MSVGIPCEGSWSEYRDRVQRLGELIRFEVDQKQILLVAGERQHVPAKGGQQGRVAASSHHRSSSSDAIEGVAAEILRVGPKVRPVATDTDRAVSDSKNLGKRS